MRETTARKRILPKGALDLIEALLVLDPEQRITASDSMKSFYFQARPLAPKDPAALPAITNLPHSHEYQTKKIRREQAKLMNGGNNSSAANTGANAAGGGSKSGTSPSANAKAKNTESASAKPDTARDAGEPSAKKRRRDV